MSWQVLTSNITIGSFQFSGVHEIRIRRTIHSYVETATITLPAIAYYKKSGQSATQRAATATLFKEGDAVHINLGYNGDVNNEFVGFVKHRGTGMPLVVECEGYSYQLRQNKNISLSNKPTSAKDLLAKATAGTDIEVVCPVDFKMSGLQRPKANGAQICDLIMNASESALRIFFITPRQLFCGLVYTAYAEGKDPFNSPQIDYRLGFNCPKQNALKERVPNEPIQVIIKGKYAGDVLHSSSKEKSAKTKSTHLNSHLQDADTMNKFGQEKAYTKNYIGYEGNLTAFGSPYADIGMKLNIQNAEYADLNGIYLTEGKEISFGTGGFRRIMQVGPKLNFGSDSRYTSLTS